MDIGSSDMTMWLTFGPHSRNRCQAAVKKTENWDVLKNKKWLRAIYGWLPQSVDSPFRTIRGWKTK